MLPLNEVERSGCELVKTQDIDTSLLNEYIKKRGIKIGAIADNLGISRQAFDAKRSGKVSFRASEVYVVCDLLRIPDDDKEKIFCLEGCK